jgi:hypothetical protein
VRAYDGTGAHHNSRTAYRALPNTAVHVNGSKTTQDSAKTKRQLTKSTQSSNNSLRDDGGGRYVADGVRVLHDGAVEVLLLVQVVAVLLQARQKRNSADKLMQMCPAPFSANQQHNRRAAGARGYC